MIESDIHLVLRQYTKFLIRDPAEIRRWLNKLEFRFFDFPTRCAKLIAEGIVSPSTLVRLYKRRGITRWSLEKMASGIKNGVTVSVSRLGRPSYLDIDSERALYSWLTDSNVSQSLKTIRGIRSQALYLAQNQPFNKRTDRPSRSWAVLYLSRYNIPRSFPKLLPPDRFVDPNFMVV